MCGRYVSATPPDQIAAYFGTEAPEALLDPSYNVAPTNDVYAVLADGSTRHLDAFHWGLVPLWAKDPKIGSKMINARSETLAEKNAYKAAFKRRRCLIPADGFYEWKKDPAAPPKAKKQPYFIHRPDGEPYAFAGLWEVWKGPNKDQEPLRSCTIITTSPNAAMRQIHDRMPVILPPSAWDTWLDPEVSDLDLLGKLLVPSAPEIITMHPVSTEVNNVRNKGEHLVEEHTIDEEEASVMATILMLGGSGFVGRHITEAAIAAGHEVTLFNRGKTNSGLFPGTAQLVGDRYAGGFDALRTGSWDAVIDVNGYHPDHVTPVLDALDGRVGHYTFISTVSVYQQGDDPIDETSPLDTEVHDTTDEPHANYGSDKVRCEQAVEARFGGHTTVIRPGIVAGPHDPTERFTHWVRAAASDGPIRAVRPDQPVQVIHGRDQGDFVVRATVEGAVGRFNTTGPTEPVTMAEMIAACAQAAGTSNEVIWMTEDEVAADATQTPLYLPTAEGADGLFMASCAAAVAAGLVNRPLVETAADTLAWTRASA